MSNILRPLGGRAGHLHPRGTGCFWGRCGGGNLPAARHSSEAAADSGRGSRPPARHRGQKRLRQTSDTQTVPQRTASVFLLNRMHVHKYEMPRLLSLREGRESLVFLIYVNSKGKKMTVFLRFHLPPVKRKKPNGAHNEPLQSAGLRKLAAGWDWRVTYLSMV